MYIIGLTGGIATGKSTVSSILSNLGVLVIDADEVARQVVEPGQPAYRDIVERFGPDVLQAGGELDRKRLAKTVFASKEALTDLNRITHPRIIEEIQNRINKAKIENRQAVVIDAALLIEAGMVSMVDTVWVVVASKEEQAQRLLSQGFTSNEAQQRIEAQMKSEEKLGFADVIIENSGTPDDLSTRVKEIWDMVKPGGSC